MDHFEAKPHLFSRVALTTSARFVTRGGVDLEGLAGRNRSVH